MGRFIAGGCATTMADRIRHRPYLGESAVNRTFIYETSCQVKWDICKTGVNGHVHCMSSASHGDIPLHPPPVYFLSSWKAYCTYFMLKALSFIYMTF